MQLNIAPNSWLARSINAVNLKDALGDIETDGGNLHSGRLLFCGVTERRPRQALDAVQQGPSTPTTSTSVLTVQGAASMAALKVNGSAVTQPVSGTVTVANPLVSWLFSATAEASRVFKFAPGTLYSLYVTTPSAGFLMLFDAATVPADGRVTPVDMVQRAANVTTPLDYTSTPLLFAAGIVAVCSSTGPFVKTASPIAFIKGAYL